MDKLAPKLIRRAQKKNYIAIVIDPIYKVITGDENSADQMANFCNQFDRVCTELGAAVIYCHHHSKGGQGGKKSMDRASGSGVFARDPDVLIDLIELELNDNILKQEENKAVCNVSKKFLEKHVTDWDDDVSQDDLLSEKAMLDISKELLSKAQYQNLQTLIKGAVKAVHGRTAWRIEGTLREFPKFPPVNLWFDYPVHYVDKIGVLKDIDTDSEQTSWKKNFKGKKSADERKKDKLESLNIAIECCSFEEVATVKSLAEYQGTTEKTIRRHIKEHPDYEIIHGEILRRDRDKVE
jgi:RecA-family ATPase